MRKPVAVVLIAAAVAFGVFWVLTIPAVVSSSALPQRSPNLGNGRTMFLIGGCSSCHATPEQDDKTRLGGGFALKSPFGIFYAPNISADPNDGIGRWSEVDFVSAMTKGTAPDGSHLYPAFPYTSYQRMTLDDVRDLFAYLKTLPAVAGKSKPHELPFPFNIRRTLGVWKFLFLDGKPFAPDPGRDPVWNRGAYLVNGPGHCAECHSPRNVLGGIIERPAFCRRPRSRTARAGCPTSRSTLWATGPQGPRRRCWKPGDPATTRWANRCRMWCATPRNSVPTDREAMAAYIKSLPPLVGPKRPDEK